MQNISTQKTVQGENVDENSKGFPCNPASSPAKTKHVEASHVLMGTQKPTFILVQENGVVKAKKVVKVVKVVKPQVPACIKACDVSSLLDQFLEYEQNQSSSVMIAKGSSVLLTPASSPSHPNNSRFVGHDSRSSQLVTSPNGPTPPVSPLSESPRKVTIAPSPSKPASLTKAPTKNAASVTCIPNANRNTSMAPNTVQQKIVFKVVPPTHAQIATLPKNVVTRPNISSAEKTANLPCRSSTMFMTTRTDTALVSKDKIALQPKTPSKSIPANTEKANAMEIAENEKPMRREIDNQNNNVVKTQKFKTEITVDQSEANSFENTSIEKSRKTTVSKEVSRYDCPVKYEPSEQVQTQNPMYKIPQRIPDVYRKRCISTDDDDDENESRDDYQDFKRKKYKRDECYWSTSDEENDDDKRDNQKCKKRREFLQKASSNDFVNDIDNDSKAKRSCSHKKYERQQNRSRSPSQTHSYSEDERHTKHQRRHEKSPLKEDIDESSVHLYDIENERKKNFKLDRAIKETSKEKRKIVYIGNIDDSMTKSDIWSKFRKYGPIEKTTVHYRKDGDNYSFVTFVDSSSALEAIEEGKADPDLKHLDICFGGRRKFCGGSYVDFDSTTSSFEEQQEKEGSRKTSHSIEEIDFDTLLQMALKNKKK